MGISEQCPTPFTDLCEGSVNMVDYPWLLYEMKMATVIRVDLIEVVCMT